MSKIPAHIYNLCCTHGYYSLLYALFDRDILDLTSCGTASSDTYYYIPLYLKKLQPGTYKPKVKKTARKYSPYYFKVSSFTSLKQEILKSVEKCEHTLFLANL